MLVNQSHYNVETELKARMYMGRPVRFCFIVVLPVLFVALGIVLLFVEGVNLFFPIFLFVFAAASIFAASFYPILLRRLIAKLLNGKSGEIVCTFLDDGLSVHAEESLGVENAAGAPYSIITKCGEYADMWLLYRGSVVLPLEKAGMTRGTAEELSVLLAVKLGNRYTVKYRKK